MTIAEMMNKWLESIRKLWYRVKEALKEFYQLVEKRKRQQSIRYMPVKNLPMKSQVNLRKPKFIMARSRL